MRIDRITRGSRPALIRLVPVSLFVVVTSACAGPPDLESAPSWQPSTSTLQPTTTSVVPQSDEPTNEDTERLLTILVDFVDEWNTNALKFVTAYSSDEVSYDEFLEVAHDVQLAQTRALITTRARVASLPDRLQAPTAPVLDHYDDRLALFTRVIGAIVQGNDAEFERLGVEYTELTHARTLGPILEKLFTDPAIAPYFESEGIDPQTIVDAITGTFD